AVGDIDGAEGAGALGHRAIVDVELSGHRAVVDQQGAVKFEAAAVGHVDSAAGVDGGAAAAAADQVAERIGDAAAVVDGDHAVVCEVVDADAGVDDQRAAGGIRAAVPGGRRIGGDVAAAGEIAQRGRVIDSDIAARKRLEAVEVHVAGD